LRSIVLPV
jgi:hypothetical protein